MPDPANDLADHLDTNVGSLTKGTNLFQGPETTERETAPLIPVQSAFVMEVGGPPPSDAFGASQSSLYFSQVQVLVRAKTFQAGRALVRSCLSATHLANISGYFDTRVLQSEPSYLGQTDDDLHRWSFTAELRHEV